MATRLAAEGRQGEKLLLEMRPTARHTSCTGVTACSSAPIESLPLSNRTGNVRTPWRVGRQGGSAGWAAWLAQRNSTRLVSRMTALAA
jgi:hypothetical protein